MELVLNVLLPQVWGYAYSFNLSTWQMDSKPELEKPGDANPKAAEQFFQKWTQVYS